MGRRFDQWNNAIHDRAGAVAPHYHDTMTSGQTRYCSRDNKLKNHLIGTISIIWYIPMVLILVLPLLEGAVNAWSTYDDAPHGYDADRLW